MKSNKFIIEESGLKTYESKDMIIRIIDNQINNYKLEYLSQWEKDHSTTAELKNKKIEELELKKKEIEFFFNKSNSNGSRFTIQFHIKEEVPLLAMA